MRQDNIEDIYPLSPLQQGILFHTLFAPEAGEYFRQVVFAIEGSLDTEAFGRTWQEVVDRHSILRTAFVWEEAADPVQVVCRRVGAPLESQDWRELDPAQQERRFAEHLEADRRRGFELTETPLLRLALFRFGEESWRFVWSYHHLLLDGWSVALLLRRVFAVYRALTQGERLPLTRVRPYRDYIAWLKAQDPAQAEAFWRRTLAGLRAPTPLPLAPAGTKGEGSSADHLLPLTPEMTAALQSLARTHRLTLNTFLQGAWALLLSRTSGEPDVLFGATASGRPTELAGFESMVGLFINTLPVRAEVPDATDLLTWLRRLQAAQAEARQFEYAPLVDVAGWSEIPRGQPLFESIVVFESYRIDEAVPQNDARLQVSPLGLADGSNYPLTLIVRPEPRLVLRLLYDPSRLDRPAALRLLGHLGVLLEGFAAAPQGLLASFSLLSEAERQQLLVEWNATETAGWDDLPLPELFARIARKHPEAPAVIGADGEVWSYRRLDVASSRLARHLQTLGVSPESAVGIAMERSPELILGTLAIVKAGGAYVPLDAGYPDERLAFLLEDTGARLVLVHAATRERMAALGGALVEVDRDEESPAPLESLQPLPSLGGGGLRLAYVIYTSGSTGRPKGVAVSHRAIVRLVRATNYVCLGPGDRTGFVSTISFDVATYEIWGALLTGAAVAVIPRETVLSPSALAAAVREQRVTSMFLTSSLFTRMAAEAPDAFESLSELLVGGEAVDPGAARTVLAGRPPHRLLNGYGPTESTTFAAWHPIREVPAGAANVPIGRPLSNTTLYVLDRRQALVPLGSTGELCIGGPGLARGYWNRADLTAERFIPHPWDVGERLYRTGDLARQRPDGAVEHLGRLDHQVKIRGFRIEPGEIEAVLASHPDVREAVVLPRDDGTGGRRLVAWVVLRAPNAALRAWLRERLPDYMIPSAFVVLEALPLTPNGKVDRQALPAPESAPSAADSFAAPSDPVEELLAGVWAEVLGLDRVGVHDDFFALGGHSLLATQVVSRLRQVLGVELPLRRLFDSPTVAGLARTVREAREAPAPPIVPVPRGGNLPLSFAQQRLWLIDQLDPGSPAYNMPLALRLTGEVAPGRLGSIFAAIVRRHEVLRTTFAVHAGQPVQVIAPPDDRMPWPVPILDLSHLPDAEPEAAALAREEARRPFDLRCGPLVRLALLRLGASDHVLLLTMHHIVTDGWSLGVLVREIAALHAAFAQGLPSPLPELAVQYADFAVWQRGWLQGAVLEEQLGHWRRRLAGAPRRLELPTDRPRPAVQTFRGATRPVTLSPALAAEVRELCRREGTTPFMVLLASWAFLLGRHAGQDDVVVGTPIAGRNRREIEDLIGFFVNTLVLRTDLSGEPAFRELLGKARETALDAFAHQDVPFERLVEELVPERDLAQSPLFQVLFALQNAPTGALSVPGLSLAPLLVDSGAAKFDLTLSLSEGTAGFSGTLEHNTDLFDGATVERLLARFAALLAGAVAEPGRALPDLPLLLPAELEQVVRAWNGTAREYPRDSCLPELFAEVARELPDAPAVIGSGEVWSYRRLDAESNRLARRLRALGVGPETAVGIAMERSPELVLGTLAILKAGGAYVPLDAGYPDERLAFMLEDTGAHLVLVHAATRERMAALGSALVEVGSPAPLESLQSLPSLGGGGLRLAYVIYTSGSTGRPKGVAVPHRAIVRLVRETNYVRLGPGERTGQVASISFDAATYEIWGALLTGAAVVVIPRETVLSPHAFAAALREQRVTSMFLTSALFTRMAAEVPDAFQHMSELLVGGEAVDPAAARTVLAGRPPRRLLNGYGPTESTTFAAWYPIREVPAEAVSIPIGFPLANTTLYVLDRRQSPVPPGSTGELAIGGDGLARGYLNRPELTAERFVPHPWGDGERLYRTGDLVRQRPDGAVEILGRLDHQVKIRGFRIEPGEVEAVLASHPEVRECVVEAREDRLVAWVVLNPADPRSDLDAWLRGKLPDFMVPSAFVVLEALPLSPNGKVDRKALPDPQGRRSIEERYAAPSGPVEETLAAIWCEVLRLGRVGADDDFFALGGHSLLATQVVTRVREVLGMELPLRHVFEAPTIRRLARRLREEQAGEAGAPPPSLAARPLRGGAPLSFGQQRLWFLDQLEPGNPAYNVPLAVRLTGDGGELSVDALERAFAEVVRRHAALRTTFTVEAGQPVQMVADVETARPELQLLDLSDAPEEAREQWTRELALEEARHPFDLRNGPLLRLGLLRLGEREHLLLATFHHVVADGWSLGVLLREIGALYPAFRRGEPSPLPELPLQYADFARWQRSWLQGEVLERLLADWKEKLAGAPALLELPTDRPRPAAQTYRGAAVRLTLPPALSAVVQELCRTEEVTPYMLLLAAWAVLLGRHAGQDDVLLGSPIAGRNRREVEDLIGFFVNTLVLRTDLSGNPTFGELLRRVRETALEAFAHQDVPFERLVEELVPRRDLAVPPLFQVMFVLQNAPMDAPALPGLAVSRVTVDSRVAKFDLTLNLTDRAGVFTGFLEHNTDLFDGSTAVRLLARFEALLEGAVSGPGRELANLPLLLPAERHQALVEPNEPRSGPPPESLLRLFAERAAVAPEAPAVLFAGPGEAGVEILSYGELERLSARWARSLRGLGAGPEVRVGICVRRSPRMIAGLLAVLRAGGAYVPLDPAWPEERLAWMLEDAGVDLVLTETGTAERLAAGSIRPLRLLVLDGAAPPSPACSLELPLPEQPAYVIYTSGSTGRPKGVVAVHGGLAAFTHALAGVMELTPDDRVLQAASLSFDAAAVAIWPALTRGAAVVLHPDPAALSARELLALCAAQGLTVLELPAALWRQVVREMDAAGLRFGPAVRLLMTGGESLTPEVLRQWGRIVAPEARLVSSYGPTEATVVATVFRAAGREAVGSSMAGSPLGGPLPGTAVYLLDDRLVPVPLDVPGEICLGGAGVARGYLGRPDLTAAVFLPDPWGLFGARLYRTGDRARRRPDGGLEFLGRIDQQVKIRGFRIEPGEVEALLGGHPAIREAAVLARPAATGDLQLVAYVALREEMPVREADLRVWLRQRVPEHLVPSAFVVLDALPLTSTGKVDRKALPAPERDRAGYVAPSDPTEEKLTAIWEEVLQIERVGTEDDFFALGGHSMLATQVVTRVREIFGLEIPLRRLFETPTIRELARSLDPTPPAPPRAPAAA